MSTSEVKSWSSSAETIGSNQDILTEILLRMPAKPLLKFKRVSKQWLSLISDPAFSVSHSRQQQILNKTPNALLLCTGFSYPREFKALRFEDSTVVPFLNFFHVPRIRILQSCNGLLLCQSTYLQNENFYGNPPSNMDYFSSVLNDGDTGYRYFICNPATMQFKRLAIPSYISNITRVLELFYHSSLTLAFDPSKSPYYKVICLHLFDDKSCGIHIYSSETESWTRSRIIFYGFYGMVKHTGVFCNGAIHWTTFQNTSRYFDVDSERLKIMPMPRMRDKRGRARHIVYFGESQGHLHIVVSDVASIVPLEFEVLEMASDYSGWFVRHHVDLHPILKFLTERPGNRKHVSPGPFSLLSIIRAQKEEESMIVLYEAKGRAIFYNPCDGTLKRLFNWEPRRRRGGKFGEFNYDGPDAYQYFETLVCV